MWVFAFSALIAVLIGEGLLGSTFGADPPFDTVAAERQKLISA